jgi:hypothetical protein
MVLGLSAVVLAMAVAGLFTGCGKSPTTPSPSTTTKPAGIVSLRISGPTSIAPRGRGTSTGQFSVTATLVDGSIADVTATTSWNTSAFAVLHATGRSGEFQVEGRGEATITATVGGTSASFTVLVLETGTFKVSGAVTDLASREPIDRVQVRIESGTGKGLSAYSDKAGRYALYGAAGPIELTAYTEGFSILVHVLVVNDTATDDFVLAPSGPSAGVSGLWTLSISASPSCRDRLPEVARDRQYDASINQQSARIDMTLFGPTIETWSGKVGVPKGVFDEIPGTIIGDMLSFTIVGDTDYGDFSSVDFLDHLSPTQSLGITASARGTVTGSEIRTLMNGDIEYWPSSTPAGRPAVVCRANDHVAVLRRR